MANLKGTGAPTKKTVAAIGDIYTDAATGKKYKCTFAYRSVESENFVSQWKELKTNVEANITLDGKKIEEAVSKPVETPVNTNSEPEKIPGDKSEENKAENPVDPEKKEEKPVNPNQQPKKNYTNYSKAKNK